MAEVRDLSFRDALAKLDMFFRNLEKEKAKPESLDAHHCKGKVKKCLRAVRFFTAKLSYFMDSRQKTKLMFTDSEKQMFRIIRTLMQEHLSLKMQSLKMSELLLRLRNIFDMCQQIRCLDLGDDKVGQKFRKESMELFIDLARSRDMMEQEAEGEEGHSKPKANIKQPTKQRIESALFLYRILQMAIQTLRKLQVETNSVELEVAEFGYPFRPALCMVLVQRLISAKLQYALITHNLLAICIASTGHRVKANLLRFDALHSAADWKMCIAVERVTQLAALLIRPKICVRAIRSIYGEVRTLESCFEQNENILKVIGMVKDFAKVALYNAASLAQDSSATSKRDMMNVYALLKRRMDEEKLMCGAEKQKPVTKISEQEMAGVPTLGTCLDVCRNHEDLSQPFKNSDAHFKKFFTAGAFKVLESKNRYLPRKSGLQTQKGQKLKASTLLEIAVIIANHYSVLDTAQPAEPGPHSNASDGRSPGALRAHPGVKDDSETDGVSGGVSKPRGCAQCADKQKLKKKVMSMMCFKKLKKKHKDLLKGVAESTPEMAESTPEMKEWKKKFVPALIDCVEGMCKEVSKAFACGGGLGLDTDSVGAHAIPGTE